MKELLMSMAMFVVSYVPSYITSEQQQQPSHRVEETKQITSTETKTIEVSKKIVEPQKTNKIITHVTLTCYQPVAAQCNADFTHTADNSEIDFKALKSGNVKWVAISQDLLWLIPMGSKVKITDEVNGKCYGVYTVKDKMNKRWDHRMDILIHPSSKERIYEEHIRVEVV